MRKTTPKACRCKQGKEISGAATTGLGTLKILFHLIVKIILQWDYDLQYTNEISGAQRG